MHTDLFPFVHENQCIIVLRVSRLIASWRMEDKKFYGANSNLIETEQCLRDGDIFFAIEYNENK